ncbi:MAG: sulfatase, partial [Phycisphaeraceae bacterium]
FARVLQTMSTQADQPNLVLIFSDQQHWQAMGCVDPFFETPTLDRLADESVMFDHVFCTTPQCSPSRSSMLTGLYPHRTGVWNNMGAAGGGELAQATVGAMLQAVGYRTGYFGKWHLGDHPLANAGWDARQIGTDDAATTAAACEFVRQTKQDHKPFALVVSINDPHDIYYFQQHEGEVRADEAPLPISWQRETFANKPAVQQRFMTADQGKVMQGQPREAWQHYRAWYREVVRRYDAHVGAVVDALQKADAWSDSIVMVTSDHGDMDAHHRLIFKGPFMYEHLVRVPMLVRVPERFGGRGPGKSSEHVLLTDVVPTWRDFAGLPPIETDGQSLRPLLCEQTASPWRSRPFVVGQYYGKQSWVNPLRMLRTERFKYVLPRQGMAELYDLIADPHELDNRALDPSSAPMVEELHAHLERWMQANDDPFATLEIAAPE